MSTPYLFSKIILSILSATFAKRQTLMLKKVTDNLGLSSKQTIKSRYCVTSETSYKPEFYLLNVYFQWYSCTACAAVFAHLCEAVPHNVPCIVYSVHCCGHHRISQTLTIWNPQGRSQIFTCIATGCFPSQWCFTQFRYWKWQVLVTTSNRHPIMCENKGRHR